MTNEELEARTGMVVERWTLRRMVGRGGMAAVYEGVDGDGQRAAVKMLHDEFVGRGAVQRRFLREAFIMGVAEHPDAIKVHAQGLCDGTPFFAMEFVDGETLQSRWAAVGRMAPEEVVGYVTSLLDLLAAYHKQGVVHRDIKPANLMVSGRGVRLIDFGVARYRDMGTSVAEYTRDGSTLGTPPFMPPEQALGKIDRIDQRSDIFAVGALMYALLTAKFVHGGDTNDEMLISAASKPAESLIVAAPALPEDLVRVVDKALSFYPNDRYADAAEMLGAVRELRNDAPPPGVTAAAAARSPASLVANVSAAPDEIRKAAAIAALGIGAFESIHTDATQALEVMFRGLRRVFDAIQLYDPAHPEVQRRIDDAHELIEQILHEYPDDTGFAVRMSTFEVDGEPVWTPKAPFDQIPYRMFINGLRFVRLSPGITRDELRQFLHLITQPTAELPAEDDLATALWDLDLAHIETSMVTSFTIADDVHVQNQFELEVTHATEEEQKFLRREAVAQLELLALVAATGEGGLAQAQMTSRDAVIERRLAGATLASQFRDQFVEALGRDTWELRAAMVIGAAIQEAWAEHDLKRLAAMVTAILPRYLLQEREPDAFQLAERIVGQTTQAEVRQHVIGWLFQPKNVARLMSRLAYDKEVWDEATRRRISSLLAEAPPDAVDEVIPLFAKTPALHRRVVMTCLMRHGDGRQADYVDIGVAAPSGVALDIVQVVERIEDDATPRELLRILAHPDESVREAVLNALSNRFPNAVEQVLVPMIDDESPNLRVQALRLARSLKSSTIREMLVAQVHANKFHTLPFTERRLTMETLHAIEPKLAEQACVDLARKKLNITLDPAMHTTRIMAITFLGETGLSRAGWEALEDAARRFPGNPQNVRDAATAAMDRWRSRAQ